MKAQTCLTLAALGGMAAGATLYVCHSPKPPSPVFEGKLDQNMREGVLPLDTAIAKFEKNACYISEARWLLNTEPFERWKVTWMGLNRDVDFNKKYQHGFVVVYDEDRRPFMALHAMPHNRGADPLPNAMGDSNCTLEIFALTMELSKALCRKRGHDEVISDELAPIIDVSQKAHDLRDYITGVHDAAFSYTVPIQPIRRELIAALCDDSTLSDFSEKTREKAIAKRQRALRLIGNCSDATLARLLNPATKFRLGAKGFNSNSGAADIMAILGHKHSLDLVRAPFCDHSMKIAIEAARNFPEPLPAARSRRLNPELQPA